MSDHDKPWHGTASIEENASALRSEGDNASPPVYIEPLLRQALDTGLAYCAREIADRTPVVERKP
ncbi:hypothetical protein [Lentzea sp. NPDC092896]|uniref:hypothetical protein n=1 Tax=Lentzea sp. NPDC092896 TaxID=3364127 RepID=UPI0037F3F83B